MNDPATNKYVASLVFWYWVSVIGIFLLGLAIWVIWSISDLPLPFRIDSNPTQFFVALWAIFIVWPLSAQLSVKLFGEHGHSHHLQAIVGIPVVAATFFMMLGIVLLARLIITVFD